MSRPIVRVYNNSTQTLTATATPLVLEGVVVTENAPCVLGSNNSAIVIKKSGRYHISADVIFNSTEAGTETIYFASNGTALPCTLSSFNVVADDIISMHVETDIPVSACAVVKPQITLVAEGVTGTVSHLCVGAWSWL